MNENELFPPIALLKDASPALCNWITSQLERLDKHELCRQINAVWLLQQQLAGVEQQYSFMAYPLPRLTRQERQTAVFVGASAHSLAEHEIEVIIDLDDFGIVNWIRVENFPQSYIEIEAALRKAASHAKI